MEISITTRWGSTTVIEVPDHLDVEEVIDEINQGGMPEWAAEQIDSGTAELVDWNASS